MNKSTSRPSFRLGYLVAAIAGIFAVTGAPLALAQDAANEDLEEIIVTGSYIARSQSNIASPIEIVDAEKLGAIGASSLPDLVNSLTINSGAQIYANHLDQGRSAGTTNINLRGLGEASTLVLLNGTRHTMTPAVNVAGDQFVNLSNLVPMIAVQRVEVLKDGASATYGSDAVAGVVNFITRDKFEGLEFKIEQSNNEFGGDQFNFGLIVGGEHERGNFMAAFEYMTVNPVTNAERSDDYSATRNSITAFGNPSNVISFGDDIVLPDPACGRAAAEAGVPSFVAFPAYLCRLQYGYYGNVISEEQRVQAYASGSYAVTDTTEFFGELSYANNHSIIGSVPTQPNTNPVYAPSNHPNIAAFAAGRVDDLSDPFAATSRVNVDGNKEVQWWGRVFGAAKPQNNDMKPFETFRAKAGLRGDLNDNWSYTTSYTFSIEETSAFRRESIQHELQEALRGRGGPDRDEWFYFGWDTRNQNTQALYDSIIGFYGYDGATTQKVFDGVVAGSIGELPGGSVGLALGVQTREDTLEYDFNAQSEAFLFSFFIGGSDFLVEQQTTAAFAELAMPFSENLEVNLALRYEEVRPKSDKASGESTIDPKLSFLWAPADEWSFRGSVGTSFRTPSLFTQGGSFYDASAAQDPVAGYEITFRGEFATDPSKPLVPQEATTFNIGTTYAGANGLTASIDYWNFDYDGFIAYEQPSSVLITDPNGPQVTRDSSNNVIFVVGYARNAGFLKTDGIDFNIEYAYESGVGTFTPFLQSTYMLNYNVDDPVWGPLNGLGWANRHNIGAPAIENRSNFGVLWEKDNHAANIIARYTDSYLSDEGSNRLGGPIVTSAGALDPDNFLPVDSQITIDAQYAYRFEGIATGDSVTTFRVGARNLTGERAPVFYSTAGYDERVHDPRGRYVYASIGTTF